MHQRFTSSETPTSLCTLLRDWCFSPPSLHLSSQGKEKPAVAINATFPYFTNCSHINLFWVFPAKVHFRSSLEPALKQHKAFAVHYSYWTLFRYKCFCLRPIVLSRTHPVVEAHIATLGTTAIFTHITIYSSIYFAFIESLKVHENHTAICWTLPLHWFNVS